jgi:hypothetical protein
MASRKQIHINRTHSGPRPSAQRRAPKPKRKQRASLMPLWIILALTIGIGTTITISVKKNTRKEMANAYAVDETRKETTELLKQITTAAESLALIDKKGQTRLKTAKARVLEVVGEPNPQPEASDDSPKRPNVAPKQTEEEAAEANLRSSESELTEATEAIHVNALMALSFQEAAAADHTKVMHEKHSQLAKQKRVNIAAVLTRIQELRENTKTIYDSTEAICSQIELLSTQILETKRQKEEQAAREREKQLQKERLAADEQLLKKHEALMLNLAKSFQFEQASQQIESEQAQYQTDAGRKRYRIITEQCTVLLNMKQDLIKAVATKPFTWGWRQDGTPRDIDSIKPEGPMVGGRLIPWDQVSLKQTAIILNAYITGPEVKPKTRSDNCIAAALYFHANGRNDIAKTVLSAGLSILPSLAPKATRLTGTILP